MENEELHIFLCKFFMAILIESPVNYCYLVGR
jgi:hypothetical protein